MTFWDTVEPDPIPEAYLLDISSPNGADRPLKQPWHYRWAQEADETILVALFAAKEGQKKWQGKVKSVTDEGIVLSTAQGDLSLQFDEIAKAIAGYQFNATGWSCCDMVLIVGPTQNWQSLPEESTLLIKWG